MSEVFNVLDRAQKIHTSYLLEASAGTGKTYSIENIIVRLLIDGTRPCSLSNILVVTFTKAATVDLKVRIRRNLCQTLSSLQGNHEEPLPDYLLALLEQNEEEIEYAKQQLEEALASFEQAPIFTIHGFCHRMLKEYLFEGDTSAMLGENSEGGISPILLGRLIKDFFRMELSKDLVSKGQLKRVLTAFKGLEGLESRLLKAVTAGVEITPLPTVQEQFFCFTQALSALKNTLQCTKEEIVEDFCAQAPFYKDICNPQGQPKEEHVRKVERFAELLSKDTWDISDFDLLIHDGLYIVDALHPEKRAKRKKAFSTEQLHCPNLISLLDNALKNVVERARSPDRILCIMAYRCREQIKTYLAKREIVGYEDLLINMHRAVQQPLFASKVRERFTTAIIDEFQDTDPVQWEIFRAIFRPLGQEPGRLYLVGDPKQSIYGFRQADIYTYLSAGKALGEEARASLETNYRSTPELIEALNALFSETTAPGLIALPRLGITLPYQPVQCGGKVQALPFNDGRGALHFFSFEESPEVKREKLADAEEKIFIPFIARELLQLQAQGISLSSCAVLVGDRFQGARVMEYLERIGLPTLAQHGESLTESLAYEAFQELLEGVLSPQKESSLKVALGGPFIAWTEPEVLSLDDPFALEPLISKAISLRKVWFQNGFSGFYQAFLLSSWGNSEETVIERMLSRKGGLELFHGMQQIAEMLIAIEAEERLPPRKLLGYLQELKELEEEGESTVKKRSNPGKEGVRILTIHSSKGLEFEIVFTLGVIKRSKNASLLIPVAQEQCAPCLTVVDSYEDERFIQYAREIDAEKIRQLYVAFTRAKQRLYVPLFFKGTEKVCELGTASPMELYLAMVGASDILFGDLYTRIPELTQGKSLDFIAELGKCHSITFSVLDALQEVLPKVLGEREEGVVLLLDPPQAKIVGDPFYVHSFTSLSKITSQADQAVLVEHRPPYDYENPLKSVHTLPAGSQVGVLLHYLLEKVPFRMVAAGINSSGFLPFVQGIVNKTPFKEWYSVIAEMVYDALTVPLRVGDDEFHLMALTEGEFYREHAFVYSADQKSHPEFEVKPGFVKGIIDLIFQYRGKYYLVDWKSNWLGPDESYYTETSIAAAMHHHDYYLQADIYKEAVRRYLKLVDPRPFEEIYGGAFYLFLRGLSSRGNLKVGTVRNKEKTKYEL